MLYFIILTAAVTLHQHGVTSIETSRQAAEALRPLAGPFAYFLYAAGLIGVGLLACTYALRFGRLRLCRNL